MLLMAMGIMAGLYDIPLQAFLQDRSPPASRGSIMAAYNFLAFTGMLLASGIYLLLSGPLGLRPPLIFLVNGLVTVLVTIVVVRRLPFETTRLFVRVLTNCMYRIRVEGLENVPAGGALLVANHVSWADGVLLGLACPRHPAHDRLRRILPESLARLVWPPGANHPHRHEPQVNGRVDPRPRGFATGRISMYLSRRRAHPYRRNRRVSSRFPLDIERYRRPGGSGPPGRALGEYFQLPGGQVLLEIATPLALSRHHSLRKADPRTSQRRRGPAGGRGIGKGIRHTPCAARRIDDDAARRDLIRRHTACA